MPLIVITLADQKAVTPAGKPDAEPMPVAPVVAIVKGGVIKVPQARVLEDGAATVHAVVHGTPGQFSRAAFFQRTLI